MMKKILIFVVVIVLLVIVSFGSYKYGKNTSVPTTLELTSLSTTVEQTIANDSLVMDSIFTETIKDTNPDSIECKCVHFETCVELTSEVDTTITPTIAHLVDVYQITKSNKYTNETNTDVYRIVHETDGNTYTDVAKNAFWLEDNPLTDSDIKVTLVQAIENLHKTNCVLPHSRFVTLRNAIGPHPTNSQWIFGNASCGTIFVDVVTGKVSLENPVYISNK